MMMLNVNFPQSRVKNERGGSTIFGRGCGWVTNAYGLGQYFAKVDEMFTLGKIHHHKISTLPVI